MLCSRLEILHRTMAARSAGILLVMLFLCAGCDREPPQTTSFRPALPVSRPDVVSTAAHGIQIQYADSSLDTTFRIRDLVRGTMYRVDDLNQLLILRSDTAILDTNMAYGECGTYGHTITLFDSTFIGYKAVCRGNSNTGRTEIYCIVDGQFKLAAEFHSNGNVACNLLRGAKDGYFVRYQFRRRPYRLTLTESFRISPPQEGEWGKASYWEHQYQLRFDTTDHIFYADSVRVADVWLPGEKRTLDGTFPGFALVYGTYIHTDNQWYEFQGDVFDGEESFISGRMRPRKVIREESDDTLRGSAGHGPP